MYTPDPHRLDAFGGSRKRSAEYSDLETDLAENRRTTHHDRSFDSDEVSELKKKVTLLEEQNIKLKAEVYDAKLGNSRELVLQDLKSKYKQRIKSLQDQCAMQQSMIQEAANLSEIRKVEPTALVMKEEVIKLRDQTLDLTKRLKESNSELRRCKEENEAHKQTIAQLTASLAHKSQSPLLLQGFPGWEHQNTVAASVKPQLAGSSRGAGSASLCSTSSSSSVKIEKGDAPAPMESGVSAAEAVDLTEEDEEPKKGLYSTSSSSGGSRGSERLDSSLATRMKMHPPIEAASSMPPVTSSTEARERARRTGTRGSGSGTEGGGGGGGSQRICACCRNMVSVL